MTEKKYLKAEEREREYKIYFINEEGEVDDFLITFRYNEEKKRWVSRLSGEYDEDEIEIVKKVSKEVNKS